jgi:hypothetical protein
VPGRDERCDPPERRLLGDELGGLAARLGVEDRLRHERSEVLEPVFETRREGIVGVRPERDDAAPDLPGDDDRRTERRLEAELGPLPACELGVQLGRRLEPDGSAARNDPRDDGVAAERVDTLGVEALLGADAPVADGAERVAGPAHRERPLGPEQPPDLTRHGRRELGLVRAFGDERRDAPQRRLLRGDALELCRPGVDHAVEPTSP